MGSGDSLTPWGPSGAPLLGHRYPLASVLYLPLLSRSKCQCVGPSLFLRGPPAGQRGPLWVPGLFPALAAPAASWSPPRGLGRPAHPLVLTGVSRICSFLCCNTSPPVDGLDTPDLWSYRCGAQRCRTYSLPLLKSRCRQAGVLSGGCRGAPVSANSDRWQTSDPRVVEVRSPSSSWL